MDFPMQGQGASQDVAPYRKTFDEAFTAFIDEAYGEERGPLAYPCRYALEGQGKRIRPLLVLLSCFAGGENDYRRALPAAIASELIHTYSLIHDDLPCLDNDDWRRGRPTLHKQFDEARALLAGDALLSDCWGVLTGTFTCASLSLLPKLAPAQILAQIACLTSAVGSRGMVYGQALDIYWTGRSGYSLEDLNTIHRHKTGALIAAACAMGGIAAGVSEPVYRQLQSFGEYLGLAFQVIDDLLDNSAATGKSQGKDAVQGKVTYLAAMAAEQAQALADRYTTEAIASLAPFGEQAEPLRRFARLLLSRPS